MQPDDRKNKFIRADDWIPEMLKLLKPGQTLQISPTGYSMYPFLTSQRDKVLLTPISAETKLRRGDICLYRRDNGLHVLHRIHHINRNGIYMSGDNQNYCEGPLIRSQFLAVAVELIRKDRHIKCSSLKYRLLSHIWMLALPFRHNLVLLWSRLRRK